MAKRISAESASAKNSSKPAKSTVAGKKSVPAKDAGSKPSKTGAEKSAKANAKNLRGTSTAGSKAGVKNTPTAEKLKSVTPSGYKDQTFFEQVFDVARQIPKGRVTSYGAIAASLGAKSSSRMVGWAMNLAGGAKPKVPAHRVVNRNGMLSGKHHFATPTHMQELLEREGIKVKNDTVVDFKKLFWDPMDLGD
ncbi:MAG TPA: MGMT family protein [Pseudobacter sp.]|nr:MGMT family protein [Pseudobacter sp.]